MDAIRPGQQFIVLCDFIGLSRRNADVKALLACFEILQKFYVERLAHLLFLEPPSIFWCAVRASKGCHATHAPRDWLGK